MALERDDPFDPNIYDPTYTGRVYTWGNNGEGWGGGASGEEWETSVGGRLGYGSTDSNDTPVLVLRGEQPPEDPCNPNPNLMHIVAISAGEGHSLALDIVGNVYGWGDNQYGQLGNGTNNPCTTPVKVVGHDGVGYLENIVAISGGHWHSIAVDANGTIWTWGKGSDGRLGLGDETDCNTPHPIPMVYNITQETLHFTIKTAIDDANNAGDILEASRGTYFEDVDFLAKRIELRSVDPNNSDVVEDTVIEGAGAWQVPAVEFTDNSDSILAGFTIMNGDYGIKCDSSSPTIINCVIANCGDHGLYCVDDSEVEVKNCTISGNGGDGVYCNQSTAGITNCTVEDNEDRGIYAYQTTLEIMNSTFGNNADHGIYVYYDCDVTIAQSLVKGNGEIGVLVYTDCDFVLNRSIVCDNGSDGVELESNDSVTLTNNWIYRNGISDATYRDGVWLHDNESAPLVRNNTIFGNPGYGIEVGTQQPDPNILNCIIYGNDSGDLYGGTFAVTYSCIEEGYGGTGNIQADPCFVDADANDFHLDANSPCIDKGDPGFEADANETDIDGEDRVVDGDANDTVIVDMGADEFYWSEADYSGDGVVNFIDYAQLTSYWQGSGIDYNEVFLDGDSNSVGLEEFCDEWLWKSGSLAGSMPLAAGRNAEGMAEGLRLEAAPYELVVAKQEPRIAEPVDFEYLLDWLAEVWLDPDVRESIDAEDWLKLYESVKELE